MYDSEKQNSHNIRSTNETYRVDIEFYKNKDSENTNNINELKADILNCKTDAGNLINKVNIN